MRIIGGDLGGRKLNPPANMPYTRPTTDVAREGLFNILENNLEFELLKTLDLFGGTGSISYELASRGAKELTIVEKDSQMHAFIKKTADSLGLKNITAIKMDVFKFLQLCSEKYDFIFAGPPYAFERIDKIPEFIFDNKMINFNGWFVLEHTSRNDFKKFPFYKTERNYGTTVFSIFVETRQSK